MKKSRSIRLALLGSAATALAACGDDGMPPDARYFADVQECVAIHGEGPCRDAKAQADTAWAAEAPRYARKQECESQFGAGNCETQQTGSGGSFFMPLLMGYMMGNLLGGNRFSQPVFRGPDNSAMMPRNGQLYNVGNFSGAGIGRAANFRPAAQVAPVSRGGFGNTAAAFRSSSGG